MDVEFADRNLDRLETDRRFTAGFGPAVVEAFFRKRMQQLRAAVDQRDLYALKSLHFEKLKGRRAQQRSVRLNKQWRLILEIIAARPKNRLRICAIEDYH
ncbi:MAG TPA: type II toxin-antitoxin system RelE/ParE family toxin [Gemmataceae bacterium]|nr:type II toxin-antitoxin system RelE/ParE family toxin [Gemmataceae bacterium]